jgi:hypothetical protein
MSQVTLLRHQEVTTKNSMELSPSCEANRHSACQEITRILTEGFVLLHLQELSTGHNPEPNDAVYTA